MRELKIAYGDSRLSKRWVNKKITFDELCERFKSTRRTTETVAEYQKFSRDRRDAAKDVGGYVLGHLKTGRRKKDTVESRSGITLDADHAGQDFIDSVEMLFPHKCAIYSTHSHTPEAPRLRMVVPLSRDVTPDEYAALSRLVADEIGIDFFDDSTYEPERLMYWPSTPSDGEYVFKVIGGDELDPDDYLSRLSDWRDCSLWPTSSRQSEVVQRSIRHQQDPLAKGGVVGAFCRSYPIEDAIAVFLSDVYAPSVMNGRYDYIPADSSAGVVLYDGKFAYSHHATDPACGKLLNAFDFVRVHKFGDLDEKKSYNAMADFAKKDEAVKTQLAEERLTQVAGDFALLDDGDKEWQIKLEVEKSGEVSDIYENYVVIALNDGVLKNVAYNELRDTLDVRGEVPWERIKAGWSKSDEVGLYGYLSHVFGLYSPTKADNAIKYAADKRRFHPIREYLDSLPAWDGVPRVETLLIRCLQADDTPYVRAVTRKTLAAAVARIYHPGTKFDSVLVFDGAQGIGKSTLLKDLVGDEYYSETLSLTDMDDKSGAEKLQGFWIVEIGELAGMKKADIEKVKAFISTADDKYRPSYGKTVESHPRQCIIIGSVNGERGYLRDITGNRRFWIVKVHQEEQVKKWSFTPEERDQIWAEAKATYEAGEKLYLEGDMIPAAEDAQREAMELDERQGMVEEYLERLLPEDWDAMDIYRRRDYIRDPDDPTHIKGTVRREAVSNPEIWCECFGRNLSEMKPADSYAIAALMTQVDGWERTNERCKQPVYGRQRLYRRKD